MKRILSATIIALILISTSLFIDLKKKKHISDILLKNIECLATSEEPGIGCYYYGSLDCPNEKIKVLYIV